ncbi:sensor histidine kinase [Phenylobacterium sp.]|uniref:sensor histidine kinase n=1 Tax=Phenylobacterium sp. TaxID=1871053 RepID=UPI002CCEEEFB|nr:PAS domain-containing protein [Phenylobacterium sp.]HVI32320.1 PAS domain-containing protein [Phenylobacterium sp.]
MAEPSDRPDDVAQPFDVVAEALALGMPYRIRVEADGVTRRFIHVGASCLALNGVAAEDVLADGSILYDMILPEHRETFTQAEAEAMAARRPFSIEIQMRRADGEVRWFRVASYPRVLPDGAALWDGLQADITETRRLAEELRDQRRRLQMAVEATGLGFWEWDPRGDRVTWSDRNKALFGLPADAGPLDICRYMELVHPDDLPKVQAIYLATVTMDHGGDFSVEHRTNAPASEIRWIQTHGRVLKDDGEARLVVGTSLDITERRMIEERRALLMGELAHRAKNGLTVMMAIVAQTARSVQTVEDFERVLTARLGAMAKSQDLVTATSGGPVQLSDMLEVALTPFGLARFDIAPEFAGVTIAGQMAAALGLLLHEMATNAVKYGALSARNGRVRIVSGEAPEGRVVLHWCETGGPPVAPPPRPGFGSRVLETALAPFGGKVSTAFAEHGFEARVEFPRGG